MNSKSVGARLISHQLFIFVFFCVFSWSANSVALAKDAAAVVAQPAAKKPTGPARFESEIAAFEKWDHQNAVPNDCILFVGSSTIRLWQTADAFPDLPVINRGFGGPTLPARHVLYYRIYLSYL